VFTLAKHCCKTACESDKLIFSRPDLSLLGRQVKLFEVNLDLSFKLLHLVTTIFEKSQLKEASLIRLVGTNRYLKNRRRQLTCWGWRNFWQISHYIRLIKTEEQHTVRVSMKFNS